MLPLSVPGFVGVGGCVSVGPGLARRDLANFDVVLAEGLESIGDKFGAVVAANRHRNTPLVDQPFKGVDDVLADDWPCCDVEQRLRISRKRVHRVWREEGLQVAQRRLGRRVGASTALIIDADVPNAMWAIDFQFDSAYDGRRFKIASAVDGHILVGFSSEVSRGPPTESSIASYFCIPGPTQTSKPSRPAHNTRRIRQLEPAWLTNHLGPDANANGQAPSCRVRVELSFPRTGRRLSLLRSVAASVPSGAGP